MKMPLQVKPTRRTEELRLILLRPAEIKPNPFQPRRVFDEEGIEMLSASIRENGLLQPLTVRKTESGYELIAGERRLRAAKRAGLEKVPCVVGRLNDEGSGVMALVENLQRRDLDFFEEADAIGRLMVCHDLTQEEIALKLGKSQPAVANKLRLLKLPPEVRERIRAAGLTERHARCLLRLPDGEPVQRALDRIISQNLNVAASDKLVERLLEEGSRKKPNRAVHTAVKDMRLFCNTLDKAVRSIRGTGLAVEARREEGDGFVEYVIRLPKNG